MHIHKLPTVLKKKKTLKKGNQKQNTCKKKNPQKKQIPTKNPKPCQKKKKNPNHTNRLHQHKMQAHTYKPPQKQIGAIMSRFFISILSGPPHTHTPKKKKSEINLGQQCSIVCKINNGCDILKNQTEIVFHTGR